ncbi:MAG: metallophosphoesterase family protein [Candidatus Margulisiibacteriota bacterium]
MLYGIIADVHGNLEALESALEKLASADKILCLGDVVGYGPNPNECIQKLRDVGAVCIAGNHDRAATGDLDTQWFNEYAKKAIDWTGAQLTEENKHYLKGLPLTLEFEDFQVVHGSLRQPLEEYILNLADALPTFALMTRPVCFIGHSHQPFCLAKNKDGNYGGRILADGDEFLVDDYEQAIINVGGVGQPRDGDPRACFGIYNSNNKLFSLSRSIYDISAVQKKMKAANLPQKLIDRLARGN